MPEGFDYSEYHRYNKSAIVKQLKFLIGNNHKTIPIVLVGLYLRSLNQEERAKCIEENKNKIYKKYKEEGIHILNWTTTGFLELFIKYLSGYRLDNNLSQEETIDNYEKALSEWKKISIFVKRDSSLNYILHLCKSKIGERKDLFLMFASGSAINIADKTYKNLKKEGFLPSEEYNIAIGNVNQSFKERVWFFQKKKK